MTKCLNFKSSIFKLAPRWIFSIECTWFIWLFSKKISLKIIEKYSFLLKESNWRFISTNYHYDLNFIRKFSDKLNWEYISSQVQLPEEFIIEFENKVYWRLIAIFQNNISEKFIENNLCKLKSHKNHKLCKIHVTDTVFQNLSEKYILKYNNKFTNSDWEIISAKQYLSEDFIIKFKNKIHWDKLGVIHPLDLSDKFLHENKDKINWNIYFKNQKKIYSKQFLIDFLRYIDDNDIKVLAFNRYYVGKLDCSLCNDVCLLINSFI